MDQPLFQFHPDRAFQLYLNKDHDALSTLFLAVLDHFRKTTYVNVSRELQHRIDTFVQVFLTVFTRPDYRISEPHVLPFVKLNPVVSNVVAMSGTRSTDAALSILLQQEANFIKILTLYSPRNSVRIDRRALFDSDAANASIWYCAFGDLFRSGLVREDVRKNLAEHYLDRDSRLDATYEPQELFFGSTYLGGHVDRLIKPVVNASIRARNARVYPQINCRPDPKKIAVISGFWFADHSVYRICSGFLRALKGYHLTFFGLRHPRGEGRFETSLFNEVKSLVHRPDGRLDIEPLVSNDFQVAYFPDIGMHPDSITLANLRIAPIQIASLGHSVSTWGAEIDYFISGEEAELPSFPERNYSERLVLLPGSGAIHNRLDDPPAAEPGPASIPQGDPGVYLINAPWHSMKVNGRFLGTIRKIVKASYRPIRLRVFVGSSLARNNDTIPFARDLAAALGTEHVEVIPGLPYDEYLRSLSRGCFSIDSYPFGGCNTVADSLHLRKLMVTWEGDAWYNRIGSQMLREVGLGELAATTAKNYVEITLRLLHDDAWRGSLEQKLRNANLLETTFSTRHAGSFQMALDHLIANHDLLRQEGGRRPIHIGRISRECPRP